MSEIVGVTREGIPSVGQAGQAKVATPKTVTFDAEFGEQVAPAEGGPKLPNLQDFMDRWQAHLDSKKPPATEGEATEEKEAAAEEVVEDEPVATELAVEGEEAPAEEVAAAPEGDTEELAADPEKPVAAAPFELERQRIENQELRRELESYRTGRRRDDFDTYLESPTGALRNWVAGQLGVDAKDPLVDAEMRSIYGELTFDLVPVQDDAQVKAQLRDDRFDRKVRLDRHRRQADQAATKTSEQERVAREIATSVASGLRDQFPGLGLAEQIFRRPVGEVLVDTLQRAAAAGQIKDWQGRSDTDLFTEAARLVNQFTVEWAKQNAPLLATLTPATAPAAPGTAAKPKAPAKPPATSQAAPKKAPATPRTLPPAKAGAAPSRPGSAPEPQPLSFDPEERQRQILAKHKFNRR